MSIAPYVHRCTVESGDFAGNKHVEEVTAYEAESGSLCGYCSEPLATAEQIIFHIYRELTEPTP